MYQKKNALGYWIFGQTANTKTQIDISLKSKCPQTRAGQKSDRRQKSDRLENCTLFFPQLFPSK